MEKGEKPIDRSPSAWWKTVDPSFASDSAMLTRLREKGKLAGPLAVAAGSGEQRRQDDDVAPSAS